MNNENIVDNSPQIVAPSQETGQVVSSDRPFPSLIVERPSAKTVCLLKNLIFSKNSEMSGLSTYLYQAWKIKNKNPDLSKTLEEISMVEMRHLDELASAVVEFGGNPNYSNSNGVYWSGLYVNTTFDEKQLLENNIRAERKAIQDYRYAQDQINNQSLLVLIDKIISDEEVHIQLFESYLNKLR